LLQPLGKSGITEITRKIDTCDPVQTVELKNAISAVGSIAVLPDFSSPLADYARFWIRMRTLPKETART
jgi:hypothetical protein